MRGEGGWERWGPPGGFFKKVLLNPWLCTHTCIYSLTNVGACFFGIRCTYCQRCAEVLLCTHSLTHMSTHTCKYIYIVRIYVVCILGVPQYYLSYHGRNDVKINSVHTHTYTHTRARAHLHALSLTPPPSHPPKHSHTHIRNPPGFPESHALSLSHTKKNHPPSFPLLLNNTYTRAPGNYKVFLKFMRAHTHTHIHIRTHTHCLCVSLSHTHTMPVLPSSLLLYIHTHTPENWVAFLKVMLTHTHALSPPPTSLPSTSNPCTHVHQEIARLFRKSCSVAMFRALHTLSYKPAERDAKGNIYI